MQTWAMGLCKPGASAHTSHWQAGAQQENPTFAQKATFILNHWWEGGLRYGFYSAALQSAGVGPDQAQITMRNALQKGPPLETQTKQLMRESARKAWQQGLTPVPYIFLKPSPLKLQEATVQRMKPTGGGLKAKLGVAVPVLLRVLHLMGRKKKKNTPMSPFNFAWNFFYYSLSRKDKIGGWADTSHSQSNNIRNCLTRTHAEHNWAQLLGLFVLLPDEEQIKQVYFTHERINRTQPE